MSLLLYTIFLLLYKLGIFLASPWNTKARLWISGRKQLFPKLEQAFAAEERPVIWMHCASLGEFEQGRPLIEKTRESYPGFAILLTFFSASGYESSKNYKGADYIFYLPMENKRNAARFVQLVKPKLVLWVKYEYWYYFLKAIKEQNIPLLLISGIFREHQAFFKWYNNIYLQMLNCFSHLFVQDEMSKELLATIGYKEKTSVSGDTRFDRVIEIAQRFEPLDVISAFCGNDQVLVAGSTWQEDEEELDHYANTHPKIKFIIAPHEIDLAHLQELQKLFHHTVLYSALANREAGEGASPATTDSIRAANVLVIDNIGMLSRLYKYGTITFVGGGFGDDGVHNVLEAAVYGKPVIFGPVYEKYIEAKELLEAGGGISVATALELEEVLNRLLENKEAYSTAAAASEHYVYSKRGATAKIMEYIKSGKLLEVL